MRSRSTHNGEGETTNQISLRRGNREIADLLRKHGAGRKGKGVSRLLRPAHPSNGYRRSPILFFFANLLSRHVNKCHSNDQPLVSYTPSRRNGTSSASWATTSNQVCDMSSPLYHVMEPILVVSHLFPLMPLSEDEMARVRLSDQVAHRSLGAFPLGLGSYRLSDPFLHSINGAAAINPSAISNPLYAVHQFSFPPPAQVSAPLYENSLDYSLSSPFSSARV